MHLFLGTKQRSTSAEFVALDINKGRRKIEHNNI